MTAVRSSPPRQRAGFTLIEMLIAMAVTLLLMAALGKGFAFIGESIRDSRTQVELTNELRDVSNRLQSELGRCTVPLQPCLGTHDPAGYFMYYEGPVTDATSSIFRSVDAEVVTPDSRYGDFDDYLAFTAVAAGDNWFTGKVPRFILDQKTAELNGTTYDPTAYPAGSGLTAWDPVVIRSKYAEIIYFASPEYAAASLPAAPVYLDGDGNGLPDNIRIHRRVLLIRPDLNLSSGFIQSRLLDGINYLLADQWPVATPATITPQATQADGWLYGMAGVHQQCDLSLRRVLAANGLPTQNVAANSLDDLAKPHNRFGHIRVPGNLIGIGGMVGGQPTNTSMPVLALTDSATVLSAVSLADGTRIAPPATPSGAAVVTPVQWSGFIRPEFVLGYDRNHPSNPAHDWSHQRIGEDVLVPSALAFDIKIYDPAAPVITTSQDQVITSSSAGFREALREFTTPPGSLPSMPAVVQGDFVDLMYPVLAGGSMRGWQSRRFDRLTPPAQTDAQLISLHLISEFSGLSSSISGTSGPANSYQPSLYKSGKILLDGSNQVRIFQPTFDTYTYHYEHDGYLQESSGTNYGSRWLTGVPPAGTAVDLAADGLNHNATRYAASNFFERETAPPFLAALRGVQITVRLENPLNRQVRQMTVVHSDSR